MKRLVIVGIITALVAASTVATTAATRAQKATITMTEFKFSPKTITVRVGTPVELTLINKGTVAHEFMVYTAPKGTPENWDEYVMGATYFRDMGEIEGIFEGQGAVAGTRIFEVEVEKGKSATLEFIPTRKGTFEIGCHVEGHYEGGMKGTFVVK